MPVYDPGRYGVAQMQNKHSAEKKNRKNGASRRRTTLFALYSLFIRSLFAAPDVTLCPSDSLPQRLSPFESISLTQRVTHVPLKITKAVCVCVCVRHTCPTQDH
jgi:hypothetical protein